MNNSFHCRTDDALQFHFNRFIFWAINFRHFWILHKIPQVSFAFQPLFFYFYLFKTHLIARLLDFKWFQRWFISSRRRCSIIASSCDVSELRSFLPVPSRRSYTTRCASISDCKSCRMKEFIIIIIIIVQYNKKPFNSAQQREWGGKSVEWGCVWSWKF